MAPALIASTMTAATIQTNPAATYSVSLWDDVCGWDGPDCEMTRTEAWDAVKSVARAKVYKNGECVWSVGCSERFFVLLLDVAGIMWPVAAHTDRKVFDALALRWRKYAGTVEERNVAPEQYDALMFDCDACEQRLTHRL
jgi:hypothetical protein